MVFVVRIKTKSQFGKYLLTTLKFMIFSWSLLQLWL